MKLIVGLGNPGKEYENTRHSIGFMVLDHLANSAEFRFRKSRFKAETALAKQAGEKVFFVKPLTFMNLSGEAVGPILRYYKLDSSDLLVVHDDLDLSLGRIRFSVSRSSGGHRGIDSIIEILGTRDFNRLRIGIGRSAFSGDSVEYVLSNFQKAEKKKVNQVICEAGLAIEFYFNHSIRTCMNEFNGRDIGGI